MLDLRPDAIIADFFVLATGISDRQLDALVDHVRKELKEQHGILPHGVEGIPESGWMLMDYGDVIVHLFREDRRAYYNLEGLYRNAKVLLHMQ